MLQELAGLRPQVKGVVGRQGAEFGTQSLKRPVQGPVQDGLQLRVPGVQGRVTLLVAAQFGAVPLGEVGELRLVLLCELFVGALIGERHDRADELAPVAYRRGGDVDGNPFAVLRPQDLLADPVLAAGSEGVAER